MKPHFGKPFSPTTAAGITTTRRMVDDADKVVPAKQEETQSVPQTHTEPVKTDNASAQGKD